MTQAWDADVNSADLSQYQRDLAATGLKQAQYNRPTTYGPFGSSMVDANGNITQQFTGGFGALNDSLTNQAANAAAHPMDWGQFGTLGTGADAGQQTAQAAYSQSLSRLNPFWQKSQNKLNTGLFQSGMADSTAGDTTQGEFGRARNDAYAGAMSDAMTAGMGAQQSAFQGNLQSRQSSISNALRNQTQPFEELGGLQSFMTQPEVGRDNSMLMRDAAFDQLAPLTAQAEKEKAQGAKMDADTGMFQDKPGEAPGSGERRRQVWESLTPEMRDFYSHAPAGSFSISLKGQSPLQWKP